MTGWFGRKFARKLALAFCFTTILAVIAISVLVERGLSRTMIGELTAGNGTTASIVAAETDPSFFVRRDAAALHKAAHELAEASGARITFIAPDGVVLGDSALTDEGRRKMENHAGRPEVRAALEGALGSAARRSATTGERFLYVAVPLKSGGQTVGIVRAALPLTRVEGKISTIQHRVTAVCLAVLLMALFGAVALASTLSRPVVEMSATATRLAAGDYGARVTDVSTDEHGRLADTMNLLAERVQAKVEELSSDKAQLTAILSNMTEAVVAVDAAGRVILVNAALSRLFGVDPAAAAGKLFLEVLRHNQIDELVRLVLEKREPRVEEVRAFAPDERIFEAQAAPLTREGAFAGAVIVLHDITRIRQLEQIRRDFVANVSHELRTPLASIKGFAETLEMGAIDDAKNRIGFVKSIEGQADRMTSLVEDLLDLTAIESGQRAPVVSSFSLAELLEEVLGGLRPLANRKKVKVRVEVAPEVGEVRADRGQLRQVFVNLVDNALKFNREGGSVSITAARSPGGVDILVADTGVGIPSQDISRIFERFYRVDTARSRDLGGTGLGLSIVKHLVEANRGAVSVESSAGAGSTFRVFLPA